MRASLKKSIAVSLAALTLGVSLAVSAGPAVAGPPPFPHHHHGFGGFGLGLGLGLLGGAIAASSAYYPPDPCVRYVPVYDAWNNVIGQRPVNVCQ